MWFKNISAYRLAAGFEPGVEEFEQRLQEYIFQPCGNYELKRGGWAPPLGQDSEMLVHVAGKCWMICLQIQDRVLPASVIRDAVVERAEKISGREGRVVSRKERVQIKEDVINELTPRAFTRNRQTFAYIDLERQLLLVNTAMPARAEEVLNLLRQSLGVLQAVPVETDRSPVEIMTQWLLGQAPSGTFEPARECELQSQQESANKVGCKAQDLDGEEIKMHLQAGKRVTRLAVDWDNALSCVLSQDLVIKRIRFSEITEERSYSGAELSKAELFDQDFALMSLTFRRLLDDVFTAFGGLNISSN